MKIDVGSDRWVLVPGPGTVLRVKMAPARNAVPAETPHQRKRAGRLLAAYRERAGLTQAELADRLSSHRPTLTRNDISRWERAARLPGEYWLDWLCRRLPLSADALDLPFGGWTTVPDCRWRARPMSANRARLLPMIDSQC